MYVYFSPSQSAGLLCYTRKLEEEEVEAPRRMIGFHVGGEEIQA